MAKLELKFLGDFEVLRDGQAQPLPPSKKTRALLAFLCLNPRRFRREYLCELLWEIPDDPRGALRWSLSKLRQLVDDEDRQRLVADRTFVEMDATGVGVDVLEVRSLVDRGPGTLSLEQLECGAEHLRGDLLEGLDLPNYYDFHAWCVAEREQVARAQAALLKELVTRLEAEPERALPHARALVGLSPYDEDSRALLIRLLQVSGYRDEAEQQYQMGLRMLKEIGVVPQGALHAARRQVQQPATAVPGQRETPSGAVTAPVIEAGSGLVGRDREAATLAGLYHEVKTAGQAHFALLHGEPGIGKTRLTEALVALGRRDGAAVLTSSAYESESIRPFSLWIDAMHREDPGAFTDIFIEQEAGNRGRLFDRLGEFVAARSREQPLLLVFDDFHWCDDSSAAALHYVARWNRESRVFGLLAARAGDLLDNVAAQQAIAGLKRDGLLTEITLGALQQQALETLIRERAPGARADVLSRKCGGNPLLAVELARAEQEGDKSTSVNALVGERLSRWGADGTEVLQCAAVLTPHIELDTIARLTEIPADRIGEILELAQRQGMLTTTAHGLDFSHDLLGRAVYTTLSPLRRQVLHRKVADLREQDALLDLDRAADRAHHAVQSGDPGLAVRALVSAGRLCLRFYANEEALVLVRRAMQIVDLLTGADRICMLIDLNDIKLSAGPLDDWEAAASEYAALAEQALDHGELAHARLGYHMAAYVRWLHGQWGSAREESLQSARAVRGGSEEDQIVGMAETAKCLVMIERDLQKADAMLMEAQALSSRRGLSHHAIPAGLGILRFHENRLDEATELLKEARTLCKSAGARIDEFLANEYLLMIEFQRGRYDEALAYSKTLKTIGDKLRVGSEGPFARALEALCQYALSDRFEELEAALDALRSADAKYRLAYILTRAAQLDCERGRLESAAVRAREALGYAELLNRATETAMARGILACICRAEDQPDAAAEHEAEIARLEKNGLAGWVSAYLNQKAGQKKVKQA